MKCQIETNYLWKKDSHQEQIVVSLSDFYKNDGEHFISGIPYYILEDKIILNKLSKNNIDLYSLKINNVSNLDLTSKNEKESEISVEIFVYYNYEYLEKIEKIVCAEEVNHKYQSALFPQGLFLCGEHSKFFKLFSGELTEC